MERHLRSTTVASLVSLFVLLAGTLPLHPFSSAAQPAMNEAAGLPPVSPCAAPPPARLFLPLVSGGGGGVPEPSNHLPTAGACGLVLSEDTSSAADLQTVAHDPDGDPLSWTLTGLPAHGSATLLGATFVYTPTPDFSGLDTLRYRLSDGRGGTALGTVTMTVSPVNDAPVVTLDANPLSGTAPLVVAFTSTAVDVEGQTLTYAWSFGDGTTAGNSAATSHTYTVPGTYLAMLTVADGTATTQATKTVTVAPASGEPLAVTLSATPISGTRPLTVTFGTTIANAHGALTSSWDFGDGTTAGNLAQATHVYSRAGLFTASVTVTDTRATATVTATIQVRRLPGDLVDPAELAPPIDRSVVTSLISATEFLYTGPNAFQTGVARGTIQPKRVAVLRGRVMTRDGTPLPRVTISVLDHPEFGQTLSRDDGMFDLVANGGGLLTITYEIVGYLPIQRQVNAPWADYAWLPDVVMIPLDRQVTTIDLSSSAGIRIARGTPVTDTDGARQATLFFPEGTTAEMLMPGGSTRPLTTLNVRATEYTVGSSGPATMPAELPPSSGYTYAVELSVDEAIAAGAAEVRFSRPLPFSLENFLGFPVGATVPLGSYDRIRGVWLPGESGRVIKVLTVADGLAALDLDGDGLADSSSARAVLAITDAERRQLATLYAPGKTLARVGTSTDYTVTLTSAGRAITYRVEGLSTGSTQLTTTDPAGAQTRVVIGLDGHQTATYPDGTVVSSVFGPDPRWRMQAPFATSQTVRTPGGKLQTTTTQRTATLATPGDGLSLRAFGVTTTVNGRTFTTAYDPASRTFTQTSPAGRRYTALVDDRGRLTQEQLSDLAPTSYTYDRRGRLTTVTQGLAAGSRAIRFDYGTDGFLAGITDPISRTIAFTTDTAGRVTDLTFPDGRQVRFAYDLNGNVSGHTPPGRSEHTFGYTERDQVSTYTAPTVGTESGQTRYTYGADRQPTLVQRPDGQSVGLQYDTGGRLSLVTLPSSQWSYGYDAAGRLSALSALSAPGVSLAYAYDGGLPSGTTWTGAVAGSVTRTYDDDFRVTALSVNGSAPVALQYDADGLPTRVGDLVLTRAAQTGLIAGATLGSTTDALSYDGFGEPATYTASQAGSTVYAEQYTRDLQGRLTSKTETTDGTTHTFAYTYDLGGRLSEVRQDGVVVASYTYDANGNRLSRTDTLGTVTATYDAQDRLTLYGPTAYTHTPNGELRSKTAGGQTTAYGYDGLGTLAGVTLSGGTEVSYLLDGQGRRVGKRVDGTLVQGFLYQDGLRPIAELNGSGAVVSRFVYATGVNVPDYLVKAGVSYRIVTDHLGSPRLVIDSATGQVVQRLDYDEFGRVLLDSNPGFQPFGFAGGLYDRDTQLVRFGLRDYDAETGRWTTKDLIGFASGDPNLYAYVGNDPVNDGDPTGLISSAHTTLLRMCVSHPVECGEVADAMGLAIKAAPAIQKAAQALQRGGPAVGNAVCRIGDTLPGMGNILGPNLPAIQRQASVAIQNLPSWPIAHLGQMGSHGRWAVQHYREVLNAFNALVYRLAGLHPGGPTVGIEKLEAAHQAAVRIFGYDPTP